MAMDFYFTKERPKRRTPKGRHVAQLSEPVHTALVRTVMDREGIRTVPELDRGFPLIARMQDYFQDVFYHHSELGLLIGELSIMVQFFEADRTVASTVSDLLKAARDGRNGGFSLYGVCD